MYCGTFFRFVHVFSAQVPAFAGRITVVSYLCRNLCNPRWRQGCKSSCDSSMAVALSVSVNKATRSELRVQRATSSVSIGLSRSL